MVVERPSRPLPPPGPQAVRRVALGVGVLLLAVPVIALWLVSVQNRELGQRLSRDIRALEKMSLGPWARRD